MRSLEILEAGIQTTVQDYPGRRGMQAQGFFPAGPMDHLAHRAANLLVGNPAAGDQPLVTGSTVRLLAATALSTFPNTAAAEPTRRGGGAADVVRPR